MSTRIRGNADNTPRIRTHRVVSDPDEGIVQASPKGGESLSRRLHQSTGLGVHSEARFLFVLRKSVANDRNVNPMRDIDAAYIAGLIDGEGTVSLLRQHKQESHQVVVSISNTDRALINDLLDAIRAGKATGKRAYSDRHMPRFTCAITNRHALELLRQVAPHLRPCKARRTELFLADYIRLTPRNGRYSLAGALQRDAFIEAFFAIEPSFSGERLGPIRNDPFAVHQTSAGH